MDDKKMEIMISMNYKNSNDLVSDVKGIIEAAQTMVNRQINSTLTKRNWLIGYRISEEIMKNLDRKDVYGKQTMKNLAADLQGVYKENFDVSNLYKFKQFYEMYSDILDTASLKSFEKLTWSHYRVLLQVKDDKARTWYEKEAAEQTWSVKTLQRNISSQYYYRMLSSQNPSVVEAEMKELTADYQNDKLEFIKNPIIAEFLGMTQNTDFTESKLEKYIITNLQSFIMELGKGYAFVARQQHIRTEKEDYYIDLVFYNYILKCFVLFDLKTQKITHRSYTYEQIILNTKLPIKDSLPDKEERKQRENEIAKQEENAKLADLIELVNEYDYTEEDLKKIENQIMISFKYLEILSKTLPAFCQNMKADQQDRLVELIYRCPNQFLYTILKDIGENFDEFTNDLYSEISILRKERNVAEISLQSVRRVLEQISSVLVIALYQLVASTCTNEQSILALNEFNSKNNSNYELQNLMMCARIDDIVSFSKKVKILDKKLENNLSKSIIRFTVRDYFLRNSSMDLHGEAQSLMDQFFAGSTRKNIQMNMAKKRLSDKDRT